MTPVILLVIVGFLLIFAEVFLPGGIIGAIGLVALGAAVILAYTDLGFTAAAYVLMIEIIGGAIILMFGMKFFPFSPIGKLFILKNQPDPLHVNDPEETMIGKTGEAFTILRPSGVALIEGKRHDVISESQLIEKNTKIRVIRQEGVKLVVRKITE